MYQYLLTKTHTLLLVSLVSTVTPHDDVHVVGWLSRVNETVTRHYNDCCHITFVPTTTVRRLRFSFRGLMTELPLPQTRHHYVGSALALHVVA